jgi:PAS domain S-box-containing protein
MSEPESRPVSPVPDVLVDGSSAFGRMAPYLSDAAVLVDSDGRLIEATPKLADLLDWSEPLAPGTWVLDVVHPADVDRAVDELRTFKSFESGRIDVRLRHADETWHWYEVTGTDLREDPEVGGLVLSLRNIQDRKTAEQDLERSEARMTSLVQHASDTILVLDEMVRIQYASPSASRLFGCEPDELLNTNVLKYVAVEDKDRVAERFLAAAAPADSADFLEFRLSDIESVEHHVEAASTNLLDHPATNGIVVNIRDLEDRDRAREVSEQSERRVRKLIANISDTITLVDSDGRVMMSTGQTKEILGYPPAYWQGRSVVDLAHPDDVAGTTAFMAEVLSNREAEISEQFRARHADGSWEDVELTAVNLLDDPDVGGLVVTSRNITSHKAIERALVEAHDQALDTLEAQAEFVANVSHEVRTPIHGILGLSELLAELPLDEEGQRLVLAIRRSSENLSLVINDLLDFSKMEAGRLDLVRAPFSPHRMVADVVEILRPQARANDLVLDGLVGPEVPPWIDGDELRVRQVLVNLVGNAVKYTQEGSVTVSVTARVKELDRWRVDFAVTDTGPGIPADETEALFEPFVQATTTPEMGRRSTGLGLTITRQLTELMGGEIRVGSEVGVGSTFLFSLPTTLASPPAPDGPGRGVIVEGAGRVLVVEDSAVNQALIERQLVRLGYDPVIVAGGQEALAQLADDTGIDLVLMDWQLPGMDGLETTRRFRESEEVDVDDRLPIVAMTARSSPGDRAACMEAGMDDFLSKPTSLPALSALLAQWLEITPAAVDPSPRQVEEPTVARDLLAVANLVEEMGDAEIATTVVKTFLGELDKRLGTLRANATGGDPETLRRTAHTLKSTSLALGAIDFAEQCRRLEDAAVDADADHRPLVRHIVEGAAVFADALRSDLRALSTA